MSETNVKLWSSQAENKADEDSLSQLWNESQQCRKTDHGCDFHSFGVFWDLHDRSNQGLRSMIPWVYMQPKLQTTAGSCFDHKNFVCTTWITTSSQLYLARTFLAYNRAFSTEHFWPTIEPKNSLISFGIICSWRRRKECAVYATVIWS